MTGAAPDGPSRSKWSPRPLSARPSGLWSDLADGPPHLGGGLFAFLWVAFVCATSCLAGRAPQLDWRLAGSTPCPRIVDSPCSHRSPGGGRVGTHGLAGLAIDQRPATLAPAAHPCIMPASRYPAARGPARKAPHSPTTGNGGASPWKPTARRTACANPCGPFLCLGLGAGRAVKLPAPKGAPAGGVNRRTLPSAR